MLRPRLGVGQGAGSGVGVGDRPTARLGDPARLQRIGELADEGRLAMVGRDEGSEVVGRIGNGEVLDEGLAETAFADLRQDRGILRGGAAEDGVVHARGLSPARADVIAVRPSCRGACALDLPVFTHPDMLGHAPGVGHPERPQRLTAVLDALAQDRAGIDWREAPQASREALERVHPAAYVDRLLDASPSAGLAVLDADTSLSPGSLAAALRAAGAVVAAAEAVAEGRIERAFCAVRPPGHHAEPDQPMGFCLFSSVAGGGAGGPGGGARAGWRWLISTCTTATAPQAVVEHDASLFFASTHQWPLYPGTGAPSETGVGNVVNAVVAPGADRAAWRSAFESLMPGLDAFAPDLILVSAGFDAHRRDPLASQELEAEDFAWATRAILEVARTRCRAGGLSPRWRADTTLRRSAVLRSRMCGPWRRG